MSITAYELAKALPNKLLNADGSITDFQGNIITPANEANARVFAQTKSIPNKFITETGEVKDYAQVSLDIFVPVDDLPSTGEKSKIYLVPNNDGTFSEYYWNEGVWEALGSVSLDLSNYPTYEQMNYAIDSAVRDVLGGEY
jgi:hypothetical protein